MKQFIFIFFTLITILVFSYCSSSKKAAVKNIPLLTYEANVQQMLSEKCTPCHFPAKGGNKLAFDNFESVKLNIDSIISRIVRNPGEKGYMPFKRAKLSDSSIQIFKQWKADGLVVK
jgi:hypothetical protein